MMLSLLAAAAAATAPVPAMTTDWWSNHYDTPKKGLAPGEVSLVVAEITVTQRGAVGACVGRAYVGNPQMGPYVCSRLKLRAKFRPARDPEGKKVVGIYRKMITVANLAPDGSSTFSFKTPRFGISVPAEPGVTSDSPFEIQFYLAADGQMSSCSLIEEVGINLERHKQNVDPRTVERACAQVPVQLKPVPPRDKGGNPMPTAQNALVTVGGVSTSHN